LVIWDSTLYITNGYYLNVFDDPFKNQLYILILIAYMASQFLKKNYMMIIKKINNWPTLVLTSVMHVNGLRLTISVNVNIEHEMCKYKCKNKYV